MNNNQQELQEQDELDTPSKHNNIKRYFSPQHDLKRPKIQAQQSNEQQQQQQQLQNQIQNEHQKELPQIKNENNLIGRPSSRLDELRNLQKQQNFVNGEKKKILRMNSPEEFQSNRVKQQPIFKIHKQINPSSHDNHTNNQQHQQQQQIVQIQQQQQANHQNNQQQQLQNQNQNQQSERPRLHSPGTKLPQLSHPVMVKIDKPPLIKNEIRQNINQQNMQPINQSDKQKKLSELREKNFLMDNNNLKFKKHDSDGKLEKLPLEQQIQQNQMGPKSGSAHKLQTIEKAGGNSPISNQINVNQIQSKRPTFGQSPNNKNNNISSNKNSGNNSKEGSENGEVTPNNNQIVSKFNIPNFKNIQKAVSQKQQNDLLLQKQLGLIQNKKVLDEENLNQQNPDLQMTQSSFYPSEQQIKMRPAQIIQNDGSGGNSQLKDMLNPHQQKLFIIKKRQGSQENNNQKAQQVVQHTEENLAASEQPNVNISSSVVVTDDQKKQFSNSGPSKSQQQQEHHQQIQIQMLKRNESGPDLAKIKNRKVSDEIQSNSNKYFDDNKKVVEKDQHSDRNQKKPLKFINQDGIPLQQPARGIPLAKKQAELLKQLFNKEEKESKIERKIIYKDVFEDLDQKKQNKKLSDQKQNQLQNQQQQQFQEQYQKQYQEVVDQQKLHQQQQQLHGHQKDKKKNRRTNSDEDLEKMIRELQEIVEGDEQGNIKGKNQQKKIKQINIDNDYDIEEREDLSQDISRFTSNNCTYLGNDKEDEDDELQGEDNQHVQQSSTADSNKQSIKESLESEIGKNNFDKAYELAQNILQKNNKELLSKYQDIFGQKDQEEIQKYMGMIFNLIIQDQQKQMQSQQQNTNKESDQNYNQY